MLDRKAELKMALNISRHVEFSACDTATPGQKERDPNRAIRSQLWIYKLTEDSL